MDAFKNLFHNHNKFRTHVAETEYEECPVKHGDVWMRREINKKTKEIRLLQKMLEAKEYEINHLEKKIAYLAHHADTRNPIQTHDEQCQKTCCLEEYFQRLMESNKLKT